MKRIVVTRFSAMGDVAMVASVLKEFCQKFPEVEIIMVSRPFFAPFFHGIPNVIFHSIDTKGKHKGFLGLLKLYKELKKYKPIALANLHDNIRSNVIEMLFHFSGIRVNRITKGRMEKKRLTRSLGKIKKQLRLTTDRYIDVFSGLGYSYELKNILIKDVKVIPEIAQYYFNRKGHAIGISPFAQHKYKVFAPSRMQEVIQKLQNEDITILLFGGGKEEQSITQEWQQKYPNTFSTLGKFTLEEELAIISNLDLMISMDSSGMHMASLMGIQCLSIWGATHPYAGFIGYGQAYEDCIQVEHANRPSSVYGNKPCPCDGVEAIDLVTAEMVFEKIKKTLSEM